MVRGGLQEYAKRSGARFVLLVDRSGAVLAVAGRPDDIDPLTFSSVASAHFSAGEQLASTLWGGEYRTLLHQGGRGAVLLARVGAEAVLATLFIGQDGSEGRVQEGAELGAELEGVVDVWLTDEGRDGRGISEGWVEAAQEEIDRIFREDG